MPTTIFDANLLTQLSNQLTKLILMLSFGVLVGSFLEATGWSKWLERLTKPLARFGNFHPISGAAFSMSFISTYSANTLLADGFDNKKISKKELTLVNIMNSLPSYLTHFPSMLTITYAFIGSYAFMYAGLTFFAAFLRTFLAICYGYFFLAPPAEKDLIEDEKKELKPLKAILFSILLKFYRRIKKVFIFTIPCYIIIYFLQKYGCFEYLEKVIASYTNDISFLRPEAITIILLDLLAESSAAYSAASSLLASGAVTGKEIIMALLVGNILSSPMRAFRHQIPAYAGFFAPKMAFKLIFVNQTCRVLSLTLVAVAYSWFIM